MTRRHDDQNQCTHRSTLRQDLLFLLLVGLSLCAPTNATGSPCAAAEPLHPEATVQHETGGRGGKLYELTLDEPGILALHVSAPIDSGSRARLTLSADCGSSTDRAGRMRIRETPQELVLRIREALTLYVRVSAEAPDHPPAPYTLWSTFAPELVVPDDILLFAADPFAIWRSGNIPTFTVETLAENNFIVEERFPVLEKDVDPWEDDEVSGEKDVDPWEDDEVSGGKDEVSRLPAEPGMIVVERVAAPFAMSASRHIRCHLEKDVDPWEDDEVSGLLAEPPMIGEAPLGVSIHRSSGCGLSSPLAVGSLIRTGDFVAAAVHAGELPVILTSAADSGDLVARFFALCSADTDHDRPLCSAPLAAGDVVSDIIDSATDDDYYTLTLDRQRTVAFEVGGDIGVLGALYDGSGQHLETWASSLVRTLGPGRFYIRVAGVDGWVGEYAVGLELVR